MSYFHRILAGRRLTGHVISELNTYLVECCLYCLRKSSDCKSINFKATKHQTHSKNCQLINATKTSHPQNLLADKNYDNYELLALKKKIEKQTPVKYAKSCDDLYKSGKTTTGVYTIDSDGHGAFLVRCDMETTPGRGWTVFQRRVDGSVDFYRNWTDYKTGFGNLSGEFWLGLDKIHRLSASGQNVLRVDLESFEKETAYAVYESFSVGNESELYILNVGDYSGTAGDSLYYQNGTKFTTKDADHDNRKNGNCARTFLGAWWYNDCHSSNLNGFYFHGNHSSYADGIIWRYWKTLYYSMKKATMKLKGI
ncbi:Hypothetical predicted protein [Paramuricea clavata]|uniref:Uncharacterized protein n=1 Tax=Paramuricea clavata TaxID=317549 RepID=A0A7D9IEY3_PARCT|nr:Hypothetical predicted protein [Paramuricea clavata]